MLDRHELNVSIYTCSVAPNLEKLVTLPVLVNVQLVCQRTKNVLFHHINKLVTPQNVAYSDNRSPHIRNTGPLLSLIKRHTSLISQWDSFLINF